MGIHISGKCERVSDNVPWPRHKIGAIADCLISTKKLMFIQFNYVGLRSMQVNFCVFTLMIM